MSQSIPSKATAAQSLDFAAPCILSSTPQLHFAHGDGVLGQRLHTEVHAGCDGTAQELALRGDRVDHGGGTEGHHDHRAAREPSAGGDSVRDTVGTDLFGVVDQQRHTGPDSRFQQHVPVRVSVAEVAGQHDAEFAEQ